jgi:hypothetical protein
VQRRAAPFALAIACSCAFGARVASAVELPKVGGAPVKLDITETSIFAQRFEARDGERPEDQGYFTWLNRLNLVLGWRKLTLGMRLDSSLYAFRPADRTYSDPALRNSVVTDGASRYRNAIYPAKMWLSYKNEGLELTAGDNYVQFGRGLVLSMRKVDELGIDTTLFGGKVSFQKDPIAMTVVAGIANPSRIDEPTGRALFVSEGVPGLPPVPLYGSDRLVGAQIQAGRGLVTPPTARSSRISSTRRSARARSRTARTGSRRSRKGWGLSSAPPRRSTPARASKCRAYGGTATSTWKASSRSEGRRSRRRATRRATPSTRRSSPAAVPSRTRSR